MSSEQRYLHDAPFHVLVDALELLIEAQHYTTTEIQQAMQLAHEHHASRHPLPVVHVETLIRHESLFPYGGTY